MQAKLIEQKRILKLQCYKFVKFGKTDPEKAKCPWGYEEINEMCKNCRWFDIAPVRLDGNAIVTDREIIAAEVPALAESYQGFSKVIDVQAAEDAIKAEGEPDRGIH